MCLQWWWQARDLAYFSLPKVEKGHIIIRNNFRARSKPSKYWVELCRARTAIDLPWQHCTYVPPSPRPPGQSLPQKCGLCACLAHACLVAPVRLFWLWSWAVNQCLTQIRVDYGQASKVKLRGSLAQQSVAQKASASATGPIIGAPGTKSIRYGRVCRGREGASGWDGRKEKKGTTTGHAVSHLKPSPPHTHPTGRGQQQTAFPKPNQFLCRCLARPSPLPSMCLGPRPLPFPAASRRTPSLPLPPLAQASPVLNHAPASKLPLPSFPPSLLPHPLSPYRGVFVGVWCGDQAMPRQASRGRP